MLPVRIGSRVMSIRPISRFYQSFGSLEELFQAAVDTWYVVLDIAAQMRRPDRHAAGDGAESTIGSRICLVVSTDGAGCGMTRVGTQRDGHGRCVGATATRTRTLKPMEPRRDRSGTAVVSGNTDRTALSRKLQLTSIALGCPTSKELCARFAGVNPNTAFTAQNAYKWMRGKATPRLSSVYEDWARVLGEDFTGAFVAASTFEEFARHVQLRHQVPEAALARLSAPESEAAGTGADDRVGDLVPLVWQSSNVLCGRYLAVSFAWSRGEAGRLILGSVDIEQTSDGPPELRYTEFLFGQLVPMTGHVSGDGRAAQSVLQCTFSRRLYFLALQVPSPPANIVGGVLTGCALHDPNTRAIAGRMVLVRDRSGGDEVRHTVDYLDATVEALDAEIGNLGYALSARRTSATAALLDLLRQPSKTPELYEVDPDTVSQLGLTFDRLKTTQPAALAEIS